MTRGGPLQGPTAAETLEVRSLLSAGNVLATVSGTALTLTSDSGDNSVNVFRLNANTVEISSPNGTTINGANSPQTFALSSVSGITVNLGSGYDTYLISSKSGLPALNIGPGGILFRGAAGGGTGDNLQVFNASSNAMTIGGSVTVQGSTPLSPLAHNGSKFRSSSFDLFTQNSGDLTVLGSVFSSQSNSGSDREVNAVVTIGSGNLQIFGSVTETLAGPGTGAKGNQIASGVGNVTIDGFASCAASGSGSHNTEIDSSGPGNITIGLGVLNNESGSHAQSFSLDTFGTGSITVGLAGVTTNCSGTGPDDNGVFADPGSSVTIAGSVVVDDTTTGTGNQNLHIEGDIFIGGALLVTMNGPEAMIRINEFGGFGTVEVKGLFSATMLGTSPVIVVGDDIFGLGASPVRFDSGVSLLGSSGAGATFEYDPTNVTTPFITPVFFNIVTS